jgi:hypothetical protein
MQMPVAPVWTFLVIFVDLALVAGAVVAAVLWAQRKQDRSAGPQGGGGLLALALVVWLGVALALGAAHVFQARASGIPWIGLGVGGPIVVGFLSFRRSPRIRRIVESIPQEWLLAVQAPRVVGATFLVLLAEHRLPGQFARPAGWGDVLIGISAPFVAYAFHTRRTWSRPLAVAFNVLGIADLVIAIGTGFLYSPSPLRLFFSVPSTALMTVLPLVLVPTFLVPLWILVHAASLRALLVPGRARQKANSHRDGLSIAPAGNAVLRSGH